MTDTSVNNGQTVNNLDVTNGNFVDVQAGGTVNNTTIEGGGSVTVEASTNGPIGLGPILGLLTPGGVADGVTVNSGASLELEGTNSSAGNVVLNGGLLVVDDTASVTGTLTFTGSEQSVVQLNGGDTDFKPTITGFSASSALDSKSITFSAATFKTAVSGGNTIATLSGNGLTETFTFVGTPQLKIVANNDTDSLPEAVIVTADTTTGFASSTAGFAPAPATGTSQATQPTMSFLSHPLAAAGSPAGLGLSDAARALAATEVTAATESLGSIARAMNHDLGRSMLGALPISTGLSPVEPRAMIGAGASQHLGSFPIPAAAAHLG